MSGKWLGNYKRGVSASASHIQGLQEEGVVFFFHVMACPVQNAHRVLSCW